VIFRHKTSLVSAALAAAVVVGALAQPQLASAAPAKTAAATTHLYVATSGNDANPGTATRPFRTVQRAADVVTAGAVVHVAPGTYGPVVSRRSGTAAARIVFQSDSRWGARIVSTNGTAPWWNYGSYVDMIGFTVTAPQARLGLVSEASYVRYIGNNVYSVAKFSTCGSSGGAGIDHASYTGTGNEASRNWVHDIGPNVGCNTIQGIYVSQSRAVIRNNVVNGVSGWCLHTWHAATAVTMSHNLMMRCGVAAAGSGGAIIVGAGDNPPGAVAANFVVSNNIILDSWRGMYEGGRIGANNRFVNNVMLRVGTPSRLMKGVQSGTRTVDPLFVSYRSDGTGNYSLRPGSPLIDAATSVGTAADDYYGVRRPQGRAADIGPMERRVA
jgi:hypothetical protein